MKFIDTNVLLYAISKDPAEEVGADLRRHAVVLDERLKIETGVNDHQMPVCKSMRGSPAPRQAERRRHRGSSGCSQELMSVLDAK